MFKVCFCIFSCTLEEVYKLTEEAVHALNTFLLYMLTSHRTYCMQETIGLLTLCFRRTNHDIHLQSDTVKFQLLLVCLLTFICHTAIEIVLSMIYHVSAVEPPFRSYLQPQGSRAKCHVA